MLIDIIVSLLTVIAVIVFLYFLSVQGRQDHPGLEALRGFCYAHRGLHDAEKPENSMAAFRAALEKGYGIELDVHLLKDGHLAVFHDFDLERITGEKGTVEDLTLDQLKDYHLNGTSETIPTFRQVLDLYGGKTPLIVELKVHEGNYAQLAQAACAALENYNGPYCLESFDPRCVHWLRKNRPHLIRGQLTRNFFTDEDSPLPWFLKLMMLLQVENFLTKPDFVAHKFSDRKTPATFLLQKIWGVQGVAWTLTSPEEHKIALEEGWIPIFEDYQP